VRKKKEREKRKGEKRRRTGRSKPRSPFDRRHLSPQVQMQGGEKRGNQKKKGGGKQPISAVDL